MVNTNQMRDARLSQSVGKNDKIHLRETLTVDKQTQRCMGTGCSRTLNHPSINQKSK